MYAYAQSKVEICGVNTAKLQTLKNDEMRELLDRSHHGDKDARDKLICGNLRLVLSVIQRFTSRGENPDDLFQVGCIGLIKAIDNFDPSHEVMFSTYGVPMISGEVKRFLRDNNAVRVSRSMRDTAYRAMQIKEQLTNENGKEPNITEIAKRMELPPEDIVIALESIVEPVSLYEPVFSDGGDGRRLAGGNCHARGDSRSDRPRAKNSFHAVHRRQNTDRSRRGDRHLAGTGLTLGKRRDEPH